MSKNKGYILSIDQGTSSTKCIVFDESGHLVAEHKTPVHLKYPRPGFVEQDPEEIYQSVLQSVKECVKALDDSARIAACGISNQRESFVLWNRDGQPVNPAVLWNCKRSVSVCKALQNRGLDQTVKDRTGLLIDPYFSASKLIWLIENQPGLKEDIAKGEIFFGTIDTWLLYRLTNGTVYKTDHTNACRTMLFNIIDMEWDHHLIDLFGLNGLNLPEVHPSNAEFGQTNFEGILGSRVTIHSMIGDSHAAAFGEGCFEPGIAKATLGTGCSILKNIGSKPKFNDEGIVTTLCYTTQDEIHYAFEGAIVSAGATLEWLKNQLHLFENDDELDRIAQNTTANNGVYIIPAFSGLGAPYWNMEAKAMVTGLTFDCTREHIIRAGLESIPYQIMDVFQSMEQDAGNPLKAINIDGGMSRNHFMMQFLTNLLQIPVDIPKVENGSAFGAALLAGLGSGFYRNMDEIKEITAHKTRFAPDANDEAPKIGHRGWKDVIQKHFQ